MFVVLIDTAVQQLREQFGVSMGGVWFSGLVGLKMSADGAMIEAPKAPRGLVRGFPWGGWDIFGFCPYKCAWYSAYFT